MYFHLFFSLKSKSTTITPNAQPNENTITPKVNDSIESITIAIDTEDPTTSLINPASSSLSNNDDAHSPNERDNEKLSIEAPASLESINNNYGGKQSEFEYEPMNNRQLERLEYINQSQHPLQDEFSADMEIEEQAQHNSEWDSLSDNNIYANDIDLYAPESVPVDLSNDIAVNDMLADQGFVDPDAEIFDVNKFAGGNLQKPLTVFHFYEPIKRK